MKFDKLLDEHLLTGILLGGLVGLYFPLDAYKPLLVIVSIVMGVKVLATSK